MESWQWIFVFFAILMAVRIIPRFLRERRRRISQTTSTGTTPEQPLVKETRPESKDMMVLGELNRGVKTFDKIKNKTGLGSDELNSILEDLENRGLMRMEKKQGLFGIRVELLPTEKGFKEYYS